MRFEIRKATEADAPVIIEFNVLMARETEGKSLDPASIRQGVHAALADPAKGCYYLVQHGGQVVGQTLITYEWSDWRCGAFWWIQSVYVRKDMRNRGVFRALFGHVLDLARSEADVCGVRLYVDRHNGKAKEVYARLGLDKTDYELFELEF